MIKDSRMQEEKNCMLETQQNVSISIQLYSLWEDLLSAYIFGLSLKYFYLVVCCLLLILTSIWFN